MGDLKLQQRLDEAGIYDIIDYHESIRQEEWESIIYSTGVLHYDDKREDRSVVCDTRDG